MTIIFIVLFLGVLFGPLLIVLWAARQAAREERDREAEEAAARGTLVPAEPPMPKLLQDALDVAEKNQQLAKVEFDPDTRQEALKQRLNEYREKGLAAIRLRDELERAVLTYLGAETLDEDEKAFTVLFGVLNDLHARRGVDHPDFKRFVELREHAGIKG